MVSTDLSFLLEECIKEYQAGSNLEEILARHPQHARELRPLLETAIGVLNVRQEIKIPDRAISLSRMAFINPRPVNQPRAVFHSFNFRLSFLAIIIIICLAIGLLGTSVVSAKALPGDALYPVKLAWEKIQINLVSGLAKRLQLEQTFDHQRVMEVNQLLILDRMSQVTFSGTLAGNENSWSVAGIKLSVPDSQAGELPKLQDTVVQVTGETEGNSVKVNAIQPHLVGFTGQIQQLDPGSIQVGGVKVSLDQSTDINGELSVDQEVQITARQEDDGELVAVTVGGNQSTTTTKTNTPAPTSEEPVGSNNPKPPSPGQTSQPTQEGASPSPTNGEQPKITVSPTSEENGVTPGNGTGGSQVTPTPTSTATQINRSGSESINPTPSTEYENQKITPTLTPTPTQQSER